MAYEIPAADEYIAANCLDIEDWQASDDARKQRMLTVAGRELAIAYPKYTIPDAAVYEFANVLSVMFNDTLLMQRQGISTFNLVGVFGVNFKDGTTTMPYTSLRKFIPQSALDIIGAENGVSLSRKRAKWAVL